MILGLWLEIHKISLKYLAVSENKKVLRKKQIKNLINGAQEAAERAPNGPSWSNLNNKTKYWIKTQSINLYEFIS